HQPSMIALLKPSRFLERRHAAQHALVGEVRALPLQLFHDIETYSVHGLAEVREDRLGEVGGLIDRRVDFRISRAHRRSSNDRPTTPMQPGARGPELTMQSRSRTEAADRTGCRNR